MLSFVRKQRREALSAHEGEYKDGYVNALSDTEEYIEDVLWDEGDYEDEE